MIPIAKPHVGKEELHAIKTVLESGQLTNGPAVERFEKEFSSYIGVDHAVAVNSGTSALLCALLAGKIKGEVITTAFSFVSSASVILFAQCTPVFVDIKDDFTIDEEKVAEKINSNTKALLPVHLYGNPCSMRALTELAEDHHLVLVEDACQAHGAEYEGKKVGGFGTGCFSFYPTKNMTTAEGGMVTTQDLDVARRCRLLRNIGQESLYHYESLGYNFRMSDISAAIGCVQLQKLDALNRIRIENAHYLSQHIQVEGIEPPRVEEGKTHVFHQYTITVCDSFLLTRDELQQHLIKKGIGCRVYYPTPLHFLPFFASFAHKDLKKTEEAASHVLSLPVHPGVTKKDLDFICQSIGDAV
jgi:dTDP-4-amino-4,6-dideoxygalactose transaminase